MTAHQSYRALRKPRGARFGFPGQIGHQLVTNPAATRRFQPPFRDRPCLIERIHRALVGVRDPARVLAERRRRVGVAELGAHVREGRVLREEQAS